MSSVVSNWAESTGSQNVLDGSTCPVCCPVILQELGFQYLGVRKTTANTKFRFAEARAWQ